MITFVDETCNLWAFISLDFLFLLFMSSCKNTDPTLITANSFCYSSLESKAWSNLTSIMHRRTSIVKDEDMHSYYLCEVYLVSGSLRRVWARLDIFFDLFPPRILPVGKTTAADLSQGECTHRESTCHKIKETRECFLRLPMWTPDLKRLTQNQR